GGGNHGNQMNRKVQLAHRLDGAEYTGGTTHVVLHLIHGGAWLERDAAGIEGNALADQRHRLVLAALVLEHDDLAVMLAATGHGAEGAHAHFLGLFLAD